MNPASPPLSTGSSSRAQHAPGSRASGRRHLFSFSKSREPAVGFTGFDVTKHKAAFGAAKHRRPGTRTLNPPETGAGASAVAHPAAAAIPEAGYDHATRADEAGLYALVVQARQGDFRSQSELVLRYRSRVAGFVRPMIACKENIDDIVQVVFIKMARRMKNLRDPLVFESWLFTLARRTVLDQIRQDRCRPVMLTDELLLAHHPDTSDHERCAEIREALAVATREFDLRTRRLLEHVINGVSYGEIAAREHASVGAIKLRVHRVRLKLREALNLREV
jgi:RNA polymerase sigma-70 factor (ECF subfamily)